MSFYLSSRFPKWQFGAAINYLSWLHSTDVTQAKLPVTEITLDSLPLPDEPHSPTVPRRTWWLLHKWEREGPSICGSGRPLSLGIIMLSLPSLCILFQFLFVCVFCWWHRDQLCGLTHTVEVLHHNLVFLSLIALFL